MARNKYYTQEEDNRLLALAQDNKKSKLIDLGRKAVVYGICTGRTAEAIAQRIAVLLEDPEEKKPKTEAETMREQIRRLKEEKAQDQLTIEQQAMELNMLKAAIIDDAGVYKNADGSRALKLDFASIRRVVYSLYPEMIEDKLK